MKRVHYNKLIRDKIPSVMRKRGSAFKVSTLTPSKFKQELLLKVQEEASSLPHLNSNEEIASELADVIDVIEQIKRTFRITDSMIKVEQKKAFEKKGGFNMRLYLHWSQDDGYKTNERTFKKK